MLYEQAVTSVERNNLRPLLAEGRGLHFNAIMLCWLDNMYQSSLSEASTVSGVRLHLVSRILSHSFPSQLSLQVAALIHLFSGQA